MSSETQRVRLVTWFFVFLCLVLGAGTYWWSTREYRGEAAETINASKVGVMSSDNLGLIGHWTLDGNDIVWADANEIKDTNPGTKHDGNVAGSLAAGSAVPGQTGQGLLFNGSSDSISLGNVYNGVKTVAFWVKPNTTTQSLIDLNGTATIDMTSGTVAANNFTSPTIYVDGASPSLTPMAYRSSSATTYASRTNTTLTAPSGIQNGDLLVIIFDIGAASPPTPTPPAGFTALPSFSSPLNMTAGGFNVNMYAWYKFASSESGDYTVTHSSASSQGYIAAISGADPTTPFSPNPTTNTGTGSTTTATGLTTPRDNSLVMFVSSDWGNTANNLTGPSGSTPTFTKRMGATSQSGILYVADGVLATAGATGNKTITNNSAGGDPFGGVLISIQPPATPDTNWHHVAVTTATGINASAANIGKISSSYFGGTMDDIRFYSSELSATQVADLYQSGSAKEVDNAAHRDALTNGLVGYWTFDGRDIKWSDTTTEIKDISGNSNDGDATGSLATTSVTPGKLGQALSFNGTSDVVDIGTNGFSSETNPRTISVWVKLRALSFGYQTIVGYGNQTGSGFFSILYDGVNGNLWNVFDWNSSVSANSNAIAGVWTHLVATYSGGNASIYVNGVLSGGPSALTSDITLNGGFIGGTSGYGYFDGSIDDVRIYNRALSATEVLNLYTLGR